MDTVPFAFCGAVCATSRHLNGLIDASSLNPRFELWKAAVQMRVDVDLEVGFFDGHCAYGILQLPEDVHGYISFQDLRAIDKRRLRVINIQIGAFEARFRHLTRSTPEEVKAVLKYSLRFVNMADLRIRENEEIPIAFLTEFVTCRSPFVTIGVFVYSEEIADFLKIQMQSDCLKKLKMPRTAESFLKDEIQHFKNNGGSFFGYLGLLLCISAPVVKI